MFAAQNTKFLSYECTIYPPPLVKNLTKISFFAFCFLIPYISHAQNTWQSNTATTTSNGRVGIRTLNPQANLHIFGNQNYSEFSKTGMSINHGATARILLNTSTTSSGVYRGGEIRYSTRHMFIRNMEVNGNLSLSANNTPTMEFNSSTNKIFIGTSLVKTWDKLASTNIEHNSQNGLYIRAKNQNSYGLFIHSRPNQNAFVIESGTGFNTSRNFKVTGDGYVFARRYTTTLNDIPDYVFAPSYNLLPLSDLRTYLATNRHLPNIPSAAEMENTEVDLGELTRLLLEKIEENTLYILQLEERLKHVESKP